MNLNRWIGLVMVFSILFSACSKQADTNDPILIESTSDPMRERIEQRCKEVTSMYYELYASADKTEPQSEWEDPVLSQDSIDAIESLLMDAGLDVIDTNGV